METTFKDVSFIMSFYINALMNLPSQVRQICQLFKEIFLIFFRKIRAHQRICLDEILQGVKNYLKILFLYPLLIFNLMNLKLIQEREEKEKKLFLADESIAAILAYLLSFHSLLKQLIYLFIFFTRLVW